MPWEPPHLVGESGRKINTVLYVGRLTSKQGRDSPAKFIGLISSTDRPRDRCLLGCWSAGSALGVFLKPFDHISHKSAATLAHKPRILTRHRQLVLCQSQCRAASSVTAVGGEAKTWRCTVEVGGTHALIGCDAQMNQWRSLQGQRSAWTAHWTLQVLFPPEIDLLIDINMQRK